MSYKIEIYFTFIIKFKYLFLIYKILSVNLMGVSIGKEEE